MSRKIENDVHLSVALGGERYLWKHKCICVADNFIVLSGICITVLDTNPPQIGLACPSSNTFHDSGNKNG